jgi:hypothetical protein
MPVVSTMPGVMIQGSESVLGSINRMSLLPFITDDLERDSPITDWNGDWDKWDNWDKWDQSR